MHSRDYRKLTAIENDEWERVKKEEVVGSIGTKELRKSLFSKYPKAARHYIKLFPNNYLDIVELKDVDSLHKTINDFTKLIQNKNTIERGILKYINHTPSFLIIGSLLKKYFNFGHHEAHVFREFPLGTTYKADYLLIGKSSSGWHFVFIELESPNGNVTVQNGELGTVFRKGLSQIEDWDEWLDSNFNLLQEYFLKHKSYN